MNNADPPKNWEEAWDTIKKGVELRDAESWRSNSFLVPPALALLGQHISWPEWVFERQVRVILETSAVGLLRSNINERVKWQDFKKEVYRRMPPNNRRLSSYTLLTRLSIRLPSHLEFSIRVVDAKVTVGWNAFGSRHPLSFFVSGHGDVDLKEPFNYVPVRVVVRATSEEAAYRTAQMRLECLLGIINGVHNGSTRYSFGAPLRFHFIRTSKDQCMSSGIKVDQEHTWYDPVFCAEQLIPSLNEKHLEFVANICRNLNIAKEREKFCLVFAVFHEAGASWDHHFKILKFWNCLELLFSDEDGRTPTKLVVDRAAFLSRNRKMRASTLGLVAEIRNRWVHQAASTPFAGDVAQDLRGYVWDVMLRLLNADLRHFNLGLLRRAMGMGIEPKAIRKLIALGELALAAHKGTTLSSSRTRRRLRNKLLG